MRRRPLVTCLLASAAGAAAALPLAAWAGPGGGDYPDLRADPPERPLLQRDTSAAQPRLLLRFDGFVTNVGDGPLDVAGNPAGGRMMQRIRSAGTFTELQTVPVVYETNDGHDHWHLMRIMRYTLRAGASASSPAVAPGMKVGFCLVDSQSAPSPSPAPEPAVYSTSADFNQGFCGVGKPNLTTLRMGVSVGRRDLYDRSLPFQWVDVSETAPGTYHLAAEADPEDIVAETNEVNGMGVRAEPVTVPGHVATAVGPVAVANGAPATVTLTSRTVGSPGTRAFRITRAPSNGTLSAAVGATITGSTVTYTPRAGFSGADSFEFVAVTTTGDSQGFPRSPQRATASLQVGAAPAPAPSVAISGAPQEMVAGTAVRLGATVSGASGGVTWTASAGTIDGTGLLTAPATVPAGGTLTVRAVSTSAPQASATAVIRVAAPPVPVAAPAPELAGGGPSPSAGARVTTRRSTSGRVVLVRVTPPASGRLAVAAVRGGRAIDVCVRPATAGRTVACALRLPARLAGMPVRIAVGLRAGTTRWSARATSAR